MKNVKYLKLTGFAGALLLAGCGAADDIYVQKSQLLPAHIKNIAIRPFTNKTQVVGLEEKLMLDVSQEFIRDGRLSLVNDEKKADGILAGEITRYIKEPVSYDANYVVDEFKIWVVIDLKFIDWVTGTVLWEEPRLDETYQYFVETKPGGLTEEEARLRLWDLFARDILKRTIEGFGSVTGASEKKISNRPPAGRDGAATAPSISTATAPSSSTTPFATPLSPY